MMDIFISQFGDVVADGEALGTVDLSPAGHWRFAGNYHSYGTECCYCEETSNQLDEVERELDDANDECGRLRAKLAQVEKELLLLKEGKQP